MNKTRLFVLLFLFSYLLVGASLAHAQDISIEIVKASEKESTSDTAVIKISRLQYAFYKSLGPGLSDLGAWILYKNKARRRDIVFAWAIGRVYAYFLQDYCYYYRFRKAAKLDPVERFLDTGSEVIAPLELLWKLLYQLRLTHVRIHREASLDKDDEFY